MMQTVDHPNIVKYYETYDDKRYIYLCMELCEGGDLIHSFLNNQTNTINEKDASIYLSKLVKALIHIHS
jgi:calcium-dependent protein kinase